MVRELLHAGASIETRDADGNTPLQVAIARDKVEIVGVLQAWKEKMASDGDKKEKADGSAAIKA